MAFRYCPNCSKKITKKSQNFYECLHCGFHFYENPKPTNGLITENAEGEILLVKRRDDPKKGYWDIPGGFIDLGENFEESVQREIREELGVKVHNLKYFMSVTDRYLFKGNNYHTICFIVTGKINTHKIKIKSDISGINFFPKNKLPLDRIAFPGVEKIIKEYLKIKK